MLHWSVYLLKIFNCVERCHNTLRYTGKNKYSETLNYIFFKLNVWCFSLSLSIFCALLRFSILFYLLFHSGIQECGHHFQRSWLLWDHYWKTCLLTNLPESGHSKQMIKNMVVSISWRHKPKRECTGLSCLPGFKQLTICNYYDCLVQYAKCISDEKGEILVPLPSKSQNTALGSPLKLAESVHLLKANPNNTVQSNKKKRKGKRSWWRLLRNIVAGKVVGWSQKLTCQVNQVPRLLFSGHHFC